MELTEKQQQGLKIAVDRYNLGLPYTVISGYAGTGKSTLIKFIIAALKIKNDDVAYVAYTGKAAEVLRKKGCPNACTAHKLLYYSTKTVDGKFIFKPRTTLEHRYKLIVVDEVSMLPKNLWELLLNHNIYVIALGDPFQIPPIDKTSDNRLLEEPHIFLDEIMRQAADSEIIQLSMKIRGFEKVDYFKGKEIQVLPKTEFVDGICTWADQIIVGTNKMRTEINQATRARLGFQGEPQIGDKIISLENHWDILDTTCNSALVNGTIGYITDCVESKVSYRIGSNFTIGPIQVYKISLRTDTGEIFKDIIIDKKYILTGEKTLTSKQEYFIYKNKKILANDAPCLMDYGYAITGHRAQGSQWDKVAVVEERFPFEKVEHARWLYTAVTRASDKAVLIK